MSNFINMQQLILIPNNITVTGNNNNYIISNSHEKLSIPKNKNIILQKINNIIYFNSIYINNNIKKHNQLFGLYQKLFKTTFNGLTNKFKIIVELHGIGFKANLINDDKILQLKLGYSHFINCVIPNLIKVKVINSTQIICLSSNWLQLTQFIAKLRQLKKINRYKKKGVLFLNETIQYKEGKKNKK